MDSSDERPLRAEVPDPEFRLSTEERARIVPDVDPGALERLLGMIRSDVRGAMLRTFQHPAPGERFGYLFESDDPELQAVLEEVWAPAWEDAPDEILDQGGLPHPGREIALRRRQERTGRERLPVMTNRFLTVGACITATASALREPHVAHGGALYATVCLTIDITALACEKAAWARRAGTGRALFERLPAARRAPAASGRG